MKKLIILFFALFITTASLCHAQKIYDLDDYNFQQERMLLSSDAIFVISSFDTLDYITAYSYYGVRLWYVLFYAKILSWEIANDHIFVFSKDRAGHSTYLTCLDRYTGELIWQKP